MTGSWSAAPCLGSNLTGSSAVEGHGDKDQETKITVVVSRKVNHDVPTLDHRHNHTSQPLPLTSMLGETGD